MLRKASVFLVLLITLTAQTAVGQDTKESRPGIVVDARGQPVIDPTKNVLDLVEAAIRRQDDLRNALDKLLQTEISAQEKISQLRYDHAQVLAAAQAARLDGEARIRAEYNEKLSIAEAKRIDAIRAVDVNAVTTASQRSDVQATALANQVNQSAEVLRNQATTNAEALRQLVATTAATAAAAQQQQFAALSSRITTLEQVGAEGKGKTAYQDPVIQDLLREVRNLSQSRVGATATETGRGEVAAWVLAGIMMLIALGGLISTVIFAMMRKAK
jgi:hypothetical protein